MSLFDNVVNPWANPAVGGPNVIGAKNGGFWDTIGDGLSTSINVWLARDAALKEIELQQAAKNQAAERAILERNVQANADPGINTWGYDAGPRKLNGFNVNQDNMLLLGAMVLLVVVFQ